MCHNTLYEGSSTRAGLPALSPPPVQAAVAALAAQLAALEIKIKTLVKDVDNKKAVSNLLITKNILFAFSL